PDEPRTRTSPGSTPVPGPGPGTGPLLVRSAGRRGRVDHPAPGGLITPDVLPQALQLQNLSVVDEQVHLVAVALHVPLEHRRVGGLEHDVLQPQAVDD